jgi:hypothetical protein
MGKLTQLEKKTNHGRKLRFALTAGLYFTFPSLSYLLELGYPTLKTTRKTWFKVRI